MFVMKLKQFKEREPERRMSTVRRNKERSRQNMRVPYGRSSEEEHKVNALALGAEEGRGKLRKAGRRRKQSMIPGYPNEGTHIR